MASDTSQPRRLKGAIRRFCRRIRSFRRAKKALDSEDGSIHREAFTRDTTIAASHPSYGALTDSKTDVLQQGTQDDKTDPPLPTFGKIAEQCVSSSEEHQPSQQQLSKKNATSGHEIETKAALPALRTSSWSVVDECATTDNDGEGIPSNGRRNLGDNCHPSPSDPSTGIPAPTTQRTPSAQDSHQTEDSGPKPEPSTPIPVTELRKGLDGAPNKQDSTAQLNCIPTSSSPITSHSHLVYIRSRDDALEYARQASGTEGRLLLWTDASNRPEGNGSGTFVHQDAEESWKVHAFLTTKTKGIFHLENLAVFKAMQWALGEVRANPGTITAVMIMTDSQASLIELQRGDGRKRRLKRRFVTDVEAVTQELEALRVTVEFHWVPSHSGIPGNTVADTWSGKACRTFKKLLGPDTIPQVIDLPVLEFCGPWKKFIASIQPTSWLAGELPGLVKVVPAPKKQTKGIPGPVKVVPAPKKQTKKKPKKEVNKAFGQPAKSLETPQVLRARRAGIRRQRQNDTTDIAVTPPGRTTATTLAEGRVTAEMTVDQGTQTLSETELKAMKRIPWEFEIVGRLHPEMIRDGCFPRVRYGRVGISPQLKARITCYVATS